MQTIKGGTRQQLAIAVLAIELLFSACTAGATTPPGAQATATPSSPSSAPAKPAGSDWQTAWNQVLSAAKQEGKVVVAGPPGDSFRQAAFTFREKYPEIAIEYTGGASSDMNPRLVSEMRAGQYLWDVVIHGSSLIFALAAEDALAPLRPSLILPEVLDDAQWLGGFDEGFMDRQKQFGYDFSAFMFRNVLVNRKTIPPSELSAVEQLFDPKWRGKMSTDDPRVPSAGSFGGAYFLALKGEDWLLRLWQQDIVIARDIRQQVEWVVQNRYPIAITPDAIMVREFRNQGFEDELTPLEPDSPLGSRLVTGFGQVMLMQRPPNPNAAKVYVNWLLSREGQRDWVRLTGQNSRRLDVEGPSETAAKPSVSYINMSTEENAQHVSNVIELAKNSFK